LLRFTLNQFNYVASNYTVIGKDRFWDEYAGKFGYCYCCVVFCIYCCL